MTNVLMKEVVVGEAVDYANKGYSCSQAIACAFAKPCGLDESLLMRISSGLAGGMGGKGDTCGVVSACIVILGAAYGPRSLDESDSRERVMKLSYEFMEDFAQANDSTLCRELNGGVDLMSMEGKQVLRDSGRPLKLIRSGADLLCEFLLREREKGR